MGITKATIPKKIKINEVNPIIPDYGSGRGGQMVPSHLSESRRQSWEARYYIREDYTENSRDLRRVPFESLVEYPLAHTCEATTQGQEKKNHSKGLEGKVPEVPTGPVVGPTNQSGKPHNFVGIRKSPQDIASVMGQN